VPLPFGDMPNPVIDSRGPISYMLDFGDLFFSSITGINFGARFWIFFELDFGVLFWSSIFEIYFGGRFCRSILEINFGDQFWKSILEINFGAP
jgi:hypothetical protein